MADDALELKATPAGVSLAVQVVPGASRTRVVGVHGAALKIAVVAPPEGGKARAEVVAVLARLFGCKRGEVILMCGQTQRRKGFQIAGIGLVAARQALAAAGIALGE